MTRSHPDTQEPATRPISVAELLARNDSIGSPPVTGRRRRRRGNSDAVTVAELTGEIPIIRADTPPPGQAVSPEAPEDQAGAPDEAAPDEAAQESAAQEPASPAESAPAEPAPEGPAAEERPLVEEPGPGSAVSGAEQMSPDPVDSYAGPTVAALGADVQDGDPATAKSADAGPAAPGGRGVFTRWRSRAQSPDVAPTAELDAIDLDDDHADIEADLTGAALPQESRWSALLGGGLIVLQSIVAVLLGAGLFLAFDQLWHWNEILALVLTVLVTLGLVAAVQAVRRTVDVVSTLIAVAVGLLITLGPLALHAN